MFRTALLATTLFAAIAGSARAQPVTGLYIGGAGGANFLQTERVDLGAPLLGAGYRRSFKTGVVGLASIGYGFGNGLRLEVEGNYRNNQLGDTIAAFSLGGRERKYGGMGNVLFDLDVGSPYVYPYIGGGIGVAHVEYRERSNFSSGTLRLDDAIESTGTSFAYQAIAGLSFPIPPVVGLSLTAEYRYFALAGERSYSERFVGSGAGQRPVTFRTGRTTDNYNHSLMLGLRYAFNTPAPAVEQVAPSPMPDPANRTYLVFFDWDRADLTARARAIINEAAQATKRVAVTRIEVAGHTDSSGTSRYNQGLSTRRAQAVAAELVRLGVPQAAITTQAFGESRPLVQTASGMREPQNRRVEIVLR